MKLNHNEITMTRGETFTISRVIQNRDGSPYIVSNKFINPYILINVVSAKYFSADRYKLRKWLSLKNMPRFEITRPVNLEPYGYTTFDDNMGLPDVKFQGDETSKYADVAVFYLKDENGVINYKYWEYNNNIEGNFDGHWVDYKFKIFTAFTKDITSEWIDQNYLYDIHIVDGVSTLEYLQRIGRMFNLEGNVDNFYSVKCLYDTIKNIDEDYVKCIDDLSRPIFQDDVDYVILPSTRLYVKSN